MYGYQPPPPVPPSPGLSPLAIALIVVGGLTGLGMTVAVGAVMYLGAAAKPARPDPAVASTATTSPIAAPDTPPGPVATNTDPADEDPAHHGADTDTPHDAPSAAPPSAPTAGRSSSSSSSGGSTKWTCNATGWVRVCGFANVCNNQMVSGMGFGTDRFVAQMTAKNACEGMARAKGGSTVCMVSCRPQ